MSGPERPTKPEAIAAWNHLAVVPDGWRLVPEEPTEKMEVAIGEAMEKGVTTLDLWDDLLAAAPKPEDDR
jgi:hypothetical protein